MSLRDLRNLPGPSRLVGATVLSALAFGCDGGPSAPETGQGHVQQDVSDDDVAGGGDGGFGGGGHGGDVGDFGGDGNGSDIDGGDGGELGSRDGGSGGGGDPRQSGTNLCHLKGSQVAVLGDSYIALDPSYVLLDSQPFVTNLEDMARNAGALPEGESYRRLAMSGASMGYFPSIPGQLEATLALDSDVKLVIATGGGNDVLVFNRLCLEYSTEEELIQDQGCVDVVDNAIKGGQDMIDRGVEAGVGALIYFFYPHLPGLTNGGVGAGTYPNVILDYAYPKVQALIENAAEEHDLRTFFVDLRPVFDKDGDGMSDLGMINVDGIHPTYESSKLMAEAVWKIMQDNCLASK